MLALPTTPTVLLTEVIAPELTAFASTMRDPDAVKFLIAVAVQETGLATRQQAHGPAHSLWQFERDGVHGVLTHPRTWAIARNACGRHGVAPATDAVYDALLVDDGLGAAFARLLLWTDPEPLPGDAGQGWTAYLRLWRPGEPDLTRWPRAWRLAEDALEAVA